ncbi:MAG: hypothetical protein ACYDES_13755 [Acidimicrobiales bacterium]
MNADRLITSADHLLAGADTVTVDDSHAMDSDAIATVQLLLHNRHGQLTHQGATTWAELLTASRADHHLPGHAHTLRHIADPRS